MNTEEERSRVGVSGKTRMGALEMRDSSMQTDIPSVLINRFEPLEILDPADSKRRA